MPHNPNDVNSKLRHLLLCESAIATRTGDEGLTEWTIPELEELLQESAEELALYGLGDDPARTEALRESVRAAGRPFGLDAVLDAVREIVREGRDLSADSITAHIRGLNPLEALSKYAMVAERPLPGTVDAFKEGLVEGGLFALNELAPELAALSKVASPSGWAASLRSLPKAMGAFERNVFLRKHLSNAFRYETPVSLAEVLKEGNAILAWRSNVERSITLRTATLGGPAGEQELLDAVADTPIMAARRACEAARESIAELGPIAYFDEGETLEDLTLAELLSTREQVGVTSPQWTSVEREHFENQYADYVPEGAHYAGSDAAFTSVEKLVHDAYIAVASTPRTQRIAKTVGLLDQTLSVLRDARPEPDITSEVKNVGQAEVFQAYHVAGFQQEVARLSGEVGTIKRDLLAGSSDYRNAVLQAETELRRVLLTKPTDQYSTKVLVGAVARTPRSVEMLELLEDISAARDFEKVTKAIVLKAESLGFELPIDTEDFEAALEPALQKEAVIERVAARVGAHRREAIAALQPTRGQGQNFSIV